MDNWVSIFSTSEVFFAEQIKEILTEAEIPAVILNQRDSSYMTFGDIHVMVNQDDRERAEHVIKALHDSE